MRVSRFARLLGTFLLIACPFSSLAQSGDLEESIVEAPYADERTHPTSRDRHSTSGDKEWRNKQRHDKHLHNDDGDDAYAKDEFHHLARFERPLGLFLSLGNPAPSFVGLSLSYQSHPTFQWLASTGVFWTRDFRIQTLSGSLRMHVLPTDLTPIFGAGLAVHFFNGQGSIQSLEESVLLGSLLLGLDWSLDSGYRFAAGVQFHYPVKLVFPFVDFGLIF